MRVAGIVKTNLGSQRGLTLVEFVVAFAVAALLLVGVVTIMRYVVIQTAVDEDKTMAEIEAYYVGFWIGEDVVEAQTVERGNTTWVWQGEQNKVVGFPLILDDRVQYSLKEMANGPIDLDGRPLYNLLRTDLDAQLNGTIIVAEYISPEGTMTDVESEDVLVVTVTARVDTGEASSTYEISPRDTSAKIQWVGMQP